MRGKPLDSSFTASRDGITPAHAGKTGRKPVLQGLCQDHPRACGENFMHFLTDSIVEGSPPRMRGKLVNRFLRAETTGITPAHAGKTLRTK